MNPDWPTRFIIRAAACAVNADQRAEWLREWQSELWHVPQPEALRFSLGAFADALWLRRNHGSRAPGLRRYVESSAKCIASLSLVAAAALTLAICLAFWLRHLPMYAHVRPVDLLIGCMLTLAYSCLILPGTIAVWRAPASYAQSAWRSRLRAGIFLGLKILLVQPVLLCVFMVWILIAPIVPFACFGILAACILALRWVFQDQQRRCPVCLQLLTDPVRMGTPAQTFLEWYGAESTCSQGHGLLHTSGASTSYTGSARWLVLDDSWSPLFISEQGRNS